MLYYLCIQSTYARLEIGLFCDRQRIDYIEESKVRSSQMIAMHIASLLKKHRLHVYDLAFIGANQGPGPFTSLRVVIATLNGISFATHIPLVGVNSIEALLREHHMLTAPVALLNAYNNDVYFGLYNDEQELKMGCQNITTMLESIPHDVTPTFIGQGSVVYDTVIQKALGSKAAFAHPLPQQCSLDSLAQYSRDQWEQKHNVSTHLSPLYLKASHPAQLSR